MIFALETAQPVNLFALELLVELLIDGQPVVNPFDVEALPPGR
jgi:hypothetical protein